MMTVSTCDIGSAVLAYKIFGNGKKIDTVIEGSLNSCCAEWWDFASELTDRTVLVYDRAGCGQSTISSLSRTPENIVGELHSLLEKLGTEDKITIVGHSQGGLYVSCFARMYPEKIRKLILLDPLSYKDNDFKTLLNQKEYVASGADKTLSLKIGKTVTSMGLGFLLKGMLRNAPPFYYHEFSKEASDYILHALTHNKQYTTALAEYNLAHAKENLLLFEDLAETDNSKKASFPLVLITHDHDTMCKEIESFANASPELANKVEKTWQNIMDAMLCISQNSRKCTAPNSSHYIHLTDSSLVADEICSAE